MLLLDSLTKPYEIQGFFDKDSVFFVILESNRFKSLSISKQLVSHYSLRDSIKSVMYQDRTNELARTTYALDKLTKMHHRKDDMIKKHQDIITEQDVHTQYYRNRSLQYRAKWQAEKKGKAWTFAGGALLGVVAGCTAAIIF